MHVRKFEADSMDEALKAIKRELGPDAIILRTVSNKGLKSAFKKSKFEITAAIKEESYVKKAQVDKVLSEEQRSDFYLSPAKDINTMINQYHQPSKANSGYGSLGLNKAVKSNKEESFLSKAANSLDDFLSFSEEEKPSSENSKAMDSFLAEESFAPVQDDNTDLLIEHIQNQKKQIEILEKKFIELNQNLSLKRDRDDENHAISQVTHLLRTLNIRENIILSILKKASFELKEHEIQNYDDVFDFVLREITNSIKTELPLFSSVDLNQESVITILLSETSSGQTSIANKLAVIQEDVDVLIYGGENKEISFSQDLFQINVLHVQSLAEIVSACRKAQKQNRSVIIDVKSTTKNDSSAKHLVDSLKRTFSNIEVLLTCSALHSESFNGKILAKYKSLASGVIITHVDMCLDFGSILNLHLENSELPLKFFGTGPTVPEDIEAATSERIVASLFKL